MSLHLGRTLINNAHRLFSMHRVCVPGSLGCGLRAASGLSTRHTFSRPLTRSPLWYMTSRQGTDSHTIHHPHRACGCAGFHTQGDEEINTFLTEEIKLEKGQEKTPGKLPRIKGFEVKTEGADITLTKTSENETVTITFNVNNTVDDDAPVELDGDQPEAPTENAQQPEMVSRPPFVVEISKGGELTLGLQCAFADSDLQPPTEGDDQKDDFYDTIEIQEVALYKGHDWHDKVYSVAGNVMDGNLYDLMLNLLEERGVDGTMVDEMVEFSTTYEHKKYIQFLQELQKFVVCK